MSVQFKGSAAAVVNFAHPIDQTLRQTMARIEAAQASHLGYPYNLVGHSPVPPSLSNYLINNLGDPYAGSHYGSEVCDLERDAISWLMKLWQCDDPLRFWGSVGASGTEGNLWAMYLAREYLPTAKLIYSRDAHYSLPKAARILRMESICVDTNVDGSIDVDAFAKALPSLGGVPAIVALTCGTTFRGAHDDIGSIIGRLDAAGYGAGRRYIHVDGALNAMVLPFVDDAPFDIQPSFQHGIDSISTSGHKMIGTVMPCGALIAKRQHVDSIASAIAYLRSNDTTLMGSRNGHAVLAMWALFKQQGRRGYRTSVRECLAETDYLISVFRKADVPVARNLYSLTVVFPQPSEEIVRTYQLACNLGEAHAIIMPNVSRCLIDRFAGDYLGWWRSREVSDETQSRAIV